eukprot:2788182-Heterocapsa_arctica.AAC.1
MTTTTTLDPTPSEDGTCFISCCGCPGHFKKAWCTPLFAGMGTLCSHSETTCKACGGKWCIKQEAPQD